MCVSILLLLLLLRMQGLQRKYSMRRVPNLLCLQNLPVSHETPVHMVQHTPSCRTPESQSKTLSFSFSLSTTTVDSWNPTFDMGLPFPFSLFAITMRSKISHKRAELLGWIFFLLPKTGISTSKNKQNTHYTKIHSHTQTHTVRHSHTFRHTKNF